MNYVTTIEQFNAIPDREQAIADHQATKKALAALIELERQKRAVLYTNLFPGNVDTTETLELSGGYKLKATGSLNYKLQFSTKAKDGIPGDAALNDVIDKIEKTGNEGPFIAERLVRWKPELSVSEYKALAKDDPIKKLIDTVLTIEPGSPTLELVAPKT